MNELQKQVLVWLADGSTGDPPTPAYKTVAQALKERRLIEVSKKRGVWKATLTEEGRHYLSHGDYSEAMKEHHARPATPGAGSSRAGASGKRGTPQPEPEPAPITEPDTLPVSAEIRKPHPAVREVIDRAGRLPRPMRRRSQLILHTLVREAERRRWTVTAVIPHKQKDYLLRDEWVYPSSDLLVIDAGVAPLGVRFDEKTKRVAHVETDQERARAERDGYSYAPKYDYQPTDLLRLDLHNDYGRAHRWEDTKTLKIEDRLLDVIHYIGDATQRERDRRETATIAAREAHARYLEEQRVAQLRGDYERWERAFLHLAGEHTEHERKSAFLAAVVSQLPEPGQAGIRLGEFITWASDHVAATDPVPGFRGFDADVPNWTHLERAKAGRPKN